MPTNGNDAWPVSVTVSGDGKITGIEMLSPAIAGMLTFNCGGPYATVGADGVLTAFNECELRRIAGLQMHPAIAAHDYAVLSARLVVAVLDAERSGTLATLGGKG